MIDHPDDPHEAPDGLDDDHPEDLPPRAFNEALHYGLGDDDRLVSDISDRYPEPSSDDGPDDQSHRRDGVSPLLTLELTTVENTGQNWPEPTDSNQPTPRNPLLGTISLFADVALTPRTGLRCIGRASGG